MALTGIGPTCSAAVASNRGVVVEDLHYYRVTQKKKTIISDQADVRRSRVLR